MSEARQNNRASETAGRILLKVVIIGQPSVGKTSLLNRFVDKKFTSQYATTIGADFKRKEIYVNSEVVELNIWDTAGQERFRSLAVSFYRGADVCVLVYDVTQQSSLEALDAVRDEFILQANPPNEEEFPFLVIGNKIDMQQDRKISTEQGQEWCRKKGKAVLFFEASAKTGHNVSEAFHAAAEHALLLSKKQRIVNEYNPSSVIPEAKPAENGRRDGCC